MSYSQLDTSLAAIPWTNATAPREGYKYCQDKVPSKWSPLTFCYWFHW